jgi:hypothetical protein
MNGQRPAGPGWVKCPSVTSGGKPHFWYRRLPNRHEWIVWDRVLRAWTRREERIAPPPLVPALAAA